jgi:hypothetical protein
MDGDDASSHYVVTRSDFAAAGATSGASGVRQIAFGFLEKIRGWADRDRARRTQRRCGMVDGR